MFSAFILLPQFVEMPRSTGFGFGASITQAGLYLLPSTVTMMIAGHISGRMSSAFGSRAPLMVGVIVLTESFLQIAFLHDSPWQLYLASGLMGIGIGLAYASLANLIVETVAPEATGVATGMNAIVRTIGSSLGSQVAAGILAASVLATGFPSENAFRVAFLVSAIAVGIALVAARLIPIPARGLIATRAAPAEAAGRAS